MKQNSSTSSSPPSRGGIRLSNRRTSRERSRRTSGSLTTGSSGRRGRPKRTSVIRSTSNISIVVNDVNMGQMMGTFDRLTHDSQSAGNENDSNERQTTNATNNGNNSNLNTSNTGSNIGNTGRDIIILNETCIDLTQDESIVNENSVESDSEIQCISSFIRNPPNPELSITRERIRRRTTARERSRSPITRREQNDDIIEITNSQSVTRVSK